jgi:hypothetical protein
MRAVCVCILLLVKEERKMLNETMNSNIIRKTMPKFDSRGYFCTYVDFHNHQFIRSIFALKILHPLVVVLT